MYLRLSGRATARAAMRVYLWSLINYKLLHCQSTIVVYSCIIFDSNHEVLGMSILECIEFNMLVLH